jgi:hypothetical protein
VVFTAVITKSTIFWDITPSADVSEERIVSIFRVEAEQDTSVKAGGKQTFNGLHGVISQKIALFRPQGCSAGSINY